MFTIKLLCLHFCWSFRMYNTVKLGKWNTSYTETPHILNDISSTDYYPYISTCQVKRFNLSNKTDSYNEISINAENQRLKDGTAMSALLFTVSCILFEWLLQSIDAICQMVSWIVGLTVEAQSPSNILYYEHLRLWNASHLERIISPPRGVSLGRFHCISCGINGQLKYV